MAGCTSENWTLFDLSSALQNMHKDNKKIVVPMFQRGKRWKQEQELKFIDSLVKGYPVGTMLFYETYDNDQRTYILVDGLQRGNCIKKYITNPMNYFDHDDISDSFCETITELLEKKDKENYENLRTILIKFIKNVPNFKNIQYYPVAKEITDVFGVGPEPIGELIVKIQALFQEKEFLYDSIGNTIIPVVVYNGEESNLPEIFDRINSQGTPLDQYEVYAASWPVNKTYKIKNSNIIENVMKKYDSFTQDDFLMHGYNPQLMRTSKQLNAFEYLFGLGKLLVHKYDILSFQRSTPDDTVNPLGFELVNACLNDSDKIKTLYEKLDEIDINEFESALFQAIEFVQLSINMITKFKANTRNSSKIYHSKYQIMSMISTTFKEMYCNNNYHEKCSIWTDKEPTLSKNLLKYYVYDIITNYWSEGGTGKIHAAAKPNRYATEISPRTWRTALDSFFERSMLRLEKSKVASLKSEEYVFLNCVYLNIFTAMDQLSLSKFDVEHIAPKEQMKSLIESCKGEGLPISCIANLCYLPDKVNRSKQERNFYQDIKYLHHIDLEEVERKYSFTKQEDLEWMDISYEKPDDFSVLKEYYNEYCTNRFTIMKKLFFESLDIPLISNDAIQIASISDGDKKTDTASDTFTEPEKFGKNAHGDGIIDRCVQQLEERFGIRISKTKNNKYISPDHKKGFSILISKKYYQGKRERYWFGFTDTTMDSLNECNEKYIVFCCENESNIIVMPFDIMKQNLQHLRVTSDSNGAVLRWHIVFLKEPHGSIYWQQSLPSLNDVNIDKMRLQHTEFKIT